MRSRCRVVALTALLTLLLSACAPEADTAGGSRRSVDRGELLALACLVCHSLAREGGPDIGPTLYGVFGRPAGSVPDFEYSAALREAGFVWSPNELNEWLAAPTEFIPGTTMVFAGYGDPEDRRALIDWLQKATQPGAY